MGEFHFFTKRGTVHCYIPENYDGRHTVVFIHGYGTSVLDTVQKHCIIKQFADSGLRAMFIVAAGPLGHDQPVWNPDLPTLLNDVMVNVGVKPPKDVIAVGHGAAYRTLIHWIDYPHLKQLVLLDSFGGDLSLAKFVGAGGGLTLLTTPLTTAWATTLSKKVKLDLIRVSDTHQALIASGRYLPSLLKQSVAGVGVELYDLFAKASAMVVHEAP